MRSDALKAKPEPAMPPLDVTYPPRTGEERETLLRFVRTAPFSYGVWNRFKGLYKLAEAEAVPDAEIMGALLARIDDAQMTIGEKSPRVEFGNLRTVSGLAAWGGRLFVVRGYDYTFDDELIVFAPNPGQPLKPIKVGSLKLDIRDSNPFGVTRCGSQLCVGTRNRGNTMIRIVDLSDTAHPRLSGELTIGGSAVLPNNTLEGSMLCVGVLTQGNFAFEGLRIIDLSGPGNAQVVGEVKVSGFAGELGGVSMAGNLAALITKPVGFTWRSLPRPSGLNLIDVSSPRQPRVVGSVELQTPLCVTLHGSYAYLGIGSTGQNNNGLQIVDISDPRRPVKTGFLSLTGEIVGIKVSPDGHSVLARTQGAQIYAVDVRDSSAPQLLDTMDGLAGAWDMVFDGALAYVPAGWQGVALLSVADGKKPQRIGVPPSTETIGYMKRRGRRFLRNLAKTEPGRYVDIATELLLTPAAKNAALDPSLNWILLDTLFGGGSRFRQTKHGRGRYKPTGADGPKLNLRTREERFPSAWDARPDQLWRLLSTPNLFPDIYAFAARALRANGKSLPAISEVILEQWLASDDPLLIVLGARSAAAILASGQILSPNLTADVFFQCNAKTWKSLTWQSRISEWAGRREWALPFALRLAARIAPVDVMAARLSRRQANAAGLLARHFSWVFAARPEALLPLAAPLLGSSRPDLLALIVFGAQHAAPANMAAWLVQLGLVNDTAQRQIVLAALANGLENVVLDRSVLRGLVFSPAAFVRESGWRLIAGSATAGEPLHAIWTELLMSGQATPAVQTAMASPDALGLLERAGISPAEFVEHINIRPYLGATLSPAAFAAVAATAPASVVLALIGAAADASWAEIRPVLLRQLREGVGLEALWLAAESAMVEDVSGRLEDRLLGDPEMADTLLAVDNVRLLEIREPSFGAILGAWWARHIGFFTKNSALLYDAATHPLPDVRTPALARVGELGMDMAFALRLTESAVPPSVAVGRSFFDAEPAGGDREADYALALCDSPAALVRTMGLDYVAGRWETLPHERILRALFENPAPEIQAFVAERLGEADARLDAAPEFDAEVLRSTNRARVAKERIKIRQTAESTLDIATLLTVARGRTPRDAEWALSELARRAARGEVIEGVTLDGVVG